MKKVFALLMVVLMAGASCKKGKEATPAPPPPVPRQKSLIENGPEVPATIKPEDYYIDHISTTPYAGGPKEYYNYLYDANYNLLEIRMGGTFVNFTYENGLLTGLKRSNMPFTFQFSHNNGKIAYRHWRNEQGVLLYTDSIFYNTENWIAGIVDMRIDNNANPVFSVRVNFIWKDGNVTGETMEWYNMEAKRFTNPSPLHSYTYEKRRCLTNLVLPDAVNLQETYYAGTLSDQAISTRQQHSYYPFFVDAQRNHNIFRYSFDAANLTETIHIYRKDSTLWSINTTHFKKKP